MGRIQVMLDRGASLCVDEDMQMPGGGWAERQLKTLLKLRAIETTTWVSTIAHDTILRVCRRGLGDPWLDSQPSTVRVLIH
jgi:hypothetical protein